MKITTPAKTTAGILAVGLLMPAVALSQVTHFDWIGGTGNWSDPANWVGSGDGVGPLPTLDDPVTISNGGTAQITDGAEAKALYILDQLGAAAHVEILTGGTLTVIGSLSIGPAPRGPSAPPASGSLIVRGGSVVTSNPLNGTTLRIGGAPRVSATVVISDGGSIALPGPVLMGTGAESHTTLQIGEGGAAGVLAANWIGGFGNVVFNHNESDYTFGTQIGQISSSNEAITVIHNGPGVTTLTNTNNYALGTELNAGVLAVSSNANLGAAAGTLTFNGGTLRTTAGFAMNRATVVNAGGGALEVTTGTLKHQGVFSGAGLLAKTGLGTLAVTGTSSQTGGLSVKEGKLVIGDAANEGSLTAGTGIGAAVTVDGGEFEVFRGTVTGGAGAAGASTGGNGGVAVTQIAAGNITNSGTIRGGLGGSASVASGVGTGGTGGTGITISAPTLLTNGSLIAGRNGGDATATGFGISMGGTGGTGVQWASTGTLLNSGTIAGGNTGEGSIGGPGGVAMQISGGGVLENGTGATIRGGIGLGGQALGVQITGTAGTLVNKGTIVGGVSMEDFANNVTLHTSGAIVGGGLAMGNSTAAHLTLDGSGTQNFGAAVGTFFVFRGSLTKAGSGTWTMDRVNVYGGGTEIQAGTLVITDVGGGGSALGTGEVTVGENGKLAGIGTVLGDTLVAGTLAPGNSPGQMTFGGALLLESTAVVQMELASLSTFDEIVVGGLLTYDGTLSITLLGGYTPQVNDTFHLFDAASFAGGSQFDTVTFNVAGYAGDVNTSTGVLTITAVPEPTAASLLLITGVVFLKRRRIAT